MLLSLRKNGLTSLLKEVPGFSRKGRSETDPLERVISEFCLRIWEPRSRSQKMLSTSDWRLIWPIYPPLKTLEKVEKTPILARIFLQERKISPKRKFSGRISSGHPGVIRADIPAQNFGQVPPSPGFVKHLATDIHDPKARTSTTPRHLPKLRSEKLWADFFP